MNSTLINTHVRVFVSLVLFSGGLFLSTMNLHAGAGSTSGSVLNQGVDARGIAMGEAQTASSSGAGSLYWNPAALASLGAYSMTFMKSSFPSEVDYNSFVLGSRVSKTWALGFGFQSLQWGSIPQTDRTATKTGSVNPRETAYSFGVAKRFPWLSLGASAKSINIALESHAEGFAWDAGILTAPIWNKHITAGFATVNNGEISFRENKTELSAANKFGVAWKSDQWMASFDWVSPKAEDPYWAMGGEYRVPIIKDVDASVRGGYNAKSSSDLGGSAGLSTGAGIDYKGLAVDYAFLPMGDLGASHRLSLSYSNEEFFGESFRSFFSNITDIGGSIHGGTVKLSGAATDYGVGRTGGFFGFSFDTIWRHWIPFNTGFDFFRLKDDKPFTQLTTGGERTSSIDAMGVYVESGARIKKSSPPMAALNFGYYYLSDPSRNIGDCIDCDTEDIPIGGGQLYIAPQVGLSFSSAEILASYRLFQGSGPQDSQLEFKLVFFHRLLTDKWEKK